MERIVELILQGKFEDAEKEPEINNEDIFKILGQKACIISDMTFYGFAQYMYHKTDNLKWLNLMVSVLTSGINWVDGAYTLALFYQKKLVEKERNLTNLQNMMFFYQLPDVDFDEKEARKIAEEILKMDPHNTFVRQFFDDI